MFEHVDELESGLEQLAAGIDPDLITTGQAHLALIRLTRITKLAQAAVTVIAARACENQAAADGPGGPGAELGKLLGISTADGRRILDASTHLHSAPLVREQLLAGSLSPFQAAAIIEARRAAETARIRREAERLLAERKAREAAEAGEPAPPDNEPEPARPAPDPDQVEQDLVGSAGSSTIGRLRENAERHKAAARGPDQARHLHDSRYWRQRRFADGGVGGEYKLPPEAAARLHAMLEAETQRRFDQGRREGLREPREAYAADALCALANQPATTGSDNKSSRRSGVEFIVRVDLAALLRGEVDTGEICEIPGCGPVPVSTARALLGDSLLNLVIHDGVDIRTVVCGGRRASKALAVAIYERDPYCVDCGSAYRLEKDHDKPVALNGPTSYWNTKHRCPRCHDRKTRAEAHKTIPAGRARAAQARQAQQHLRPTGTDPP